MRLILLDLNYTLVANSEVKIKPFENQIQNEEYRKELIEKLKEDKVFLITARPDKYRFQTLNSIRSKLNWKPDGVYFNTQNLFPADHKQKILLLYVLPFYQRENILAIESNPKTRAMYHRNKIKAITYDQFLNGVN